MKKIKYRLLLIYIFTATSIYSLPYEFEAGYYYMLNNSDIFSEESLQSIIIDRLNQNDRVEIIECTLNQETIDGFTAYWYKIKYNFIEGYVWGGNIAVETLVYDLDGNGVNDYFHYRVSEVIDNYNEINGLTDIFIFINNRRIDYEFRKMGDWYVDYYGQTWNYCIFVEPHYNADYNMLVDFSIILRSYYDSRVESWLRGYDIFYLSSDGSIRYGGWGYW